MLKIRIMMMMLLLLIMIMIMMMKMILIMFLPVPQVALITLLAIILAVIFARKQHSTVNGKDFYFYPLHMKICSYIIYIKKTFYSQVLWAIMLWI